MWITLRLASVGRNDAKSDLQWVLSLRAGLEHFRVWERFSSAGRSRVVVAGDGEYMANRDILAFGKVGGGRRSAFLSGRAVSAQFPAPVLVTIHLPGQIRSELDELLSRTDRGAIEVLRRGAVSEPRVLGRVACRVPLREAAALASCAPR